MLSPCNPNHRFSRIGLTGERLKIVHIETVVSCGRYSKSADWKQKKAHIHEAVRKCDWPPGSGKFTIYPVKDGNGVVPIKKEFVAALKKLSG
jgi:predicted NUDIX family NTP pyrophosphohydrolase